MAQGPFKMKGSPMQRNFGIGSPMRQDDTAKRQPQGKMDPSKRTKRKLYEDTRGKYYKDDSGKKVYIRPKGNSGDKRNVNPYEGEKKRYFTEGKPSQRRKKIKQDAPESTIDKHFRQIREFTMK